MRKRRSPICCVIVMVCMAGLWVTSVTAQKPQAAGVQSTFNMVEAPVLKMFSAEEGGHRFVAYLVKWKNSEVVVSDPLARSQFHEGDKITFMAQKVSLPGSPMKVSSLNFTLLDTIPEVHDGTGSDGKTVSDVDRKRQMRVAQGDLDATRSETERFYALNRAAKNAWLKGDVENARALATEMEGLLPKYKNDWNYGNAVQDANQVLGLIALEAGNLAEAKKRLLASADSKGSPQMNSFGPSMRLAKALLEKGEKDVVLEYFDRCSKFWEMGNDRLEAWATSVKKGEIPEFGANLNY